MKIALVKCPCIAPFPPDIGLGYLFATASRAGHEVFVFDLNIELYSKADAKMQALWNTSDVSALWRISEELRAAHPALYEEQAKRILNTGVRIVGFSLWETNGPFSLALAQAIKQLDKATTIVFGGPACYPLRFGKAFIQNPFVDIVVYGEAERTLNEILEGTDGAAQTGGCLLKGAEGIIDTGCGRVVRDLDQLSFPDYRGFPLELYPSRKQLSLSFCRGCLRRCAYCSVPGTYPFRHRSAASIVEEMKCQMQRHPGVSEFFIASTALNCHLPQLSQMCDRIIRETLAVSWGGNALLRHDMEYDLLRKMKLAGCSNLVFGLESGSQNVLNRMEKGTTVQDAERILFNAHRAGITSLQLNFIVGFPGEEERDFEETLGFLRRNKAYINAVGSANYCWIEPYSSLYQDPKKYGIMWNADQEHVKIEDWYSEDGRNTLEVRERRKKIFAEFVSSLKLNCRTKETHCGEERTY